MTGGASIRHKLVAVILTASLAPMLVGFALLARLDLRDLRRSMLETGALLAQLQVDHSVAELVFEDREASARTLARLSGVPSVVGAALYDREGRLFASYQRTLAQRPPARIAPSRPPVAEEFEGHIDFYRPSVHEGVRYGTLLLRLSTAPMDARRRAYLVGLLAVALGMAIMSLAAALAFERVVSRPILSLADVARRVTHEQSRSVRATKTSDDEIGLLADAFNEMLDGLDERQRERDRAQAALQQSEEAARYLAEATARLAESLDFDTTISLLVHLAVPALGDVAYVFLPEFDGALRQVAVRHRDPSIEKTLERTLRLVPAGDDATHPVLAAPRSTVATTSRLAGAPHADPFLRALSGLGIGSVLSLPLVSRGQLLGVLTCGRSGTTLYGAAEMALAQGLANRAAIAVENARLYRQAQEAIRVRSDFMAVASHELRTPITALQLNLQLLLRSDRAETLMLTNPKKLRSDLERVLKQVRRLGGLVENLLDVAHLSLGRLPLTLEDVDLAAVAAEVAARLEVLSAKSGSTLTIHAPTPVVGHWDLLRIEQIVTNLFSNAIKYGSGRPIDVTVEVAGGTARLLVRDEGIGIAPEDADRIFGAFERAVSVHHFGGLGLGLHITRELVESHAGTIRVTSKPGAGSLFVVELPLEGPRPPAPDAGTRSAAASDGEQLSAH